jgi:uncharacterized membrane protein
MISYAIEIVLVTLFIINLHYSLLILRYRFFTSSKLDALFQLSREK